MVMIDISEHLMKRRISKDELSVNASKWKLSLSWSLSEYEICTTIQDENV